MRPTQATRISMPPGWRRIPPVTRALLVLVAAGYLLTLMAPAVAVWLVLAPGAVLGGQVWRLLTYAFVNASIGAVLFDLLLVWSIGSEMEPRWGSRRFGALPRGGDACSPASLGLFVGGGAGLTPTLLALIFAWMLEGPSQSLLFFGVFPMTRLGFAVARVRPRGLLRARGDALVCCASSSSSAACRSRGSSRAVRAEGRASRGSGTRSGAGASRSSTRTATSESIELTPKGL